MKLNKEDLTVVMAVTDTPTACKQIAEGTGLSPNHVMMCLRRLCMFGFVDPVSGKVPRKFVLTDQGHEVQRRWDH